VCSPRGVSKWSFSLKILAISGIPPAIVKQELAHTTGRILDAVDLSVGFVGPFDDVKPVSIADLSRLLELGFGEPDPVGSPIAGNGFDLDVTQDVPSFVLGFDVVAREFGRFYVWMPFGGCDFLELDHLGDPSFIERRSPFGGL
jgi:hypothetical protein